MKEIVVIGAGRSVQSLIEYLSKCSTENNWQITIGDINLALAEEKAAIDPKIKAIHFDIQQITKAVEQLSRADLVISMLPAHMHLPVAQICIAHKINMLTASYISPDIVKLDQDAKAAGIIILMETGLDPGIDHMSAMKLLDEIREKGGKVNLFKSYTGGLVAPESDNNPWHYKVSWNPRNVVLAGLGGVKFRRNDRYKFIPYHNLFKRTEEITVAGIGKFEGYPNRDSLKYESIYGLEGVPTLIRGTLRRPPFCEGWNVLVQLGFTDDKIQIEDFSELTYREFTNAFLKYAENDSVEGKLRKSVPMTDEVFEMLEWLGLFSSEKIGLKEASPAQILQKMIESKWKLQPHDKDMIVMQHQIGYSLDGQDHLHTSSLVVKGDDSKNTSMAKTVGLPLGIAAKMILEGEIDLKGVQIPVSKALYNPILKELEDYGIQFSEDS